MNLEKAETSSVKKFENRSFKRFWAACKFLANPFLLLESSGLEELERNYQEVGEDDLEEGECVLMPDLGREASDEEFEEGEMNPNIPKKLQIRTSNMKIDPAIFKDKKTGLALFLRDMIAILKLFNDNPIDHEESMTRKYPKYLSDECLFEYQIKEPFFRKTVLIQLKIFLYN